MRSFLLLCQFIQLSVAIENGNDASFTRLRSSTATGAHCPLCDELSDGRLDYLAGGPFNATEVGQVARNMAANMFPNGTIIASPAKGREVIYEYPNGMQLLQNDYYYMWQRDAALTMRTLIRVGGKGPEVKKQVSNFADRFNRIYSVPTPNHDCAPWGLSGWCSVYGEPKFFVNDSVYNKGWGRPQNDGPALVALVMMDMILELEPSASDAELAKNLIIATLTYVGNGASDSTIDPWEMLYGMHYFDQAIFQRAFAGGTEQAQKGSWPGSGNFANWAAMMKKQLEVHWNATDGAIAETIARPWFSSVGPKCLKSGLGDGLHGGSPCELDVATLIASLSSLAKPGLGTSFPQVNTPYDSRMLATADFLVESMASTYEVNQKDDEAGLPGTLIGRYPGDEYSGVIQNQEPNICQGFNCGNPWFLATHALAEMYYVAAAAAAEGKLKADSMNEKFIKRAYNVGSKRITDWQGQSVPGDPRELANLLLDAGDGILTRAKAHALPGMHLSEQIYRGNDKYPPLEPGIQFGVADLTWSYASLLDSLASRAEALKAIK